MTSPAEIARGIAELFEGKTFSSPHDAIGWLQEKIVTALREYGNEEYLRGFKDGSAK